MGDCAVAGARVLIMTPASITAGGVRTAEPLGSSGETVRMSLVRLDVGVPTETQDGR